MMNKIAILLAGILVLSSLSFANFVEITDLYLRIHYNADNCKAGYTEDLLGYAMDYADGHDEGLYDSLDAMGNTISADVGDLYDYAVAGDRSGFAVKEASTRRDMFDGMRAYKSAKRTSLINGWTDKKTALGNENTAWSDYATCLGVHGPT